MSTTPPDNLPEPTRLAGPGYSPETVRELLAQQRAAMVGWCIAQAQAKAACYAATQDREFLAAAGALEWAGREIARPQLAPAAPK